MRKSTRPIRSLSIASTPEFDTKSDLKTSRGGDEPKDASDEFHERFLEIADEDTSDDLIKSSLESSQMPDSDDLQFPVDQKEDKLMESGEKFALEFDKIEPNSPEKTIFAGPDTIGDLANRSEKPGKGPEIFEKKVFEKEAVQKKAQPEVSSPEAELEKLVGMPKKETKPEPGAPAPAPASAPAPGKVEMTGKLEEKLSLTIKELLWEIVPPLAEKIIKEEIDKIKSDLSNSGL